MSGHQFVPAHEPEPDLPPRLAEPDEPDVVHVRAMWSSADPFVISDPYLLEFWASKLGPTSTLLLLALHRHLVDDEATVHLLTVAGELGVFRNNELQGMRTAPAFWRAVERLERFQLLRRVTPTEWCVSITLPWLRRAWVNNLPGRLVIKHAALMAEHEAQSASTSRSG